MGIHFVCHHCSFALHVKDFQAGKRGKCPSCNGSFRIPMGDASYSSALEESSSNPAVANVKQAIQSISSTSKVDLAGDSSGSIAIALESQPASNDRSSTSKGKTADVPLQSRTGSSEPHADRDSLPAALAQARDSKWFVRPPSGGQFGPAPPQLLLSWVKESRITADSLLWREGLAQWQLANELLPELFPSIRSDLPSSGIVPAPPELPISVTNATSAVPISDPAATRAAAILRKRMLKRRQQMTMVVVLATISLVLLGILIYVLVFQVGKPPVVA